MTIHPTIACTSPYPQFDPLSALNLIKDHADWVALRYVSETSHKRRVRNGRPEQNAIGFEQGVMIEAMVDGQLAYAGTSRLSPDGLLEAVKRATHLARSTADNKAFHFTEMQRPPSKGVFNSPRQRELDSLSLAAFTDLLMGASHALKVSDNIVTAIAEATLVESHMHYVSSQGANFSQSWLLISQNFQAIAARDGEVQQRSLNGPTARCWQGGLEHFEEDHLLKTCQKVGEEALALLDADNCPNTRCDLILAPDQMLLQIHESIGHPLELDRILGDERNYAGWSFVKPKDFGHLQYGSNLMNVTYAPSNEGQFASFKFDDSGNPAERAFLIKEGRLLRGLGSLESQTRLGQPGVGNFRSSGWNRAPIDRMGNINLEPGESSLNTMIESVESGIYMESNRSWSIDDYRNKFQFGCEFGRLIEQGRLTKIVKNPNYRGVTVPFWTSLSAVGGASEHQAFGTPYCGKGEPNQMIRVGHASPPCLFQNIEVFGADV